MKFADVTNDIAFRKIFGNENKKISLISFLNAVLEFPTHNKVASVEISNPYQLPKLSGGKTTIVDVKATDQNGNTFLVEMQVAEADFFHKRILYYTSHSYVSQISEGKEYKKLKPAYFIGILEFDIGSNPNYFSRHQVRDIETGEHIIQDIEFNFIELLKFNKELHELETPIDQWTYFIKNAENLEVIPENVSDEGLKEAYKEADRHLWTKFELEEYERASIKEQDEIGILELAVRRAEERGAERGEKRGKEEGIKVEKLEVAKRLKTKGFAVTEIAEITGLSEEEINGL
jgi:predicted transposase/invertase (TIGR01784 family)